MTHIKQVKQGSATVLTVESPLVGDVTGALRDKLQSCLEAGELSLILDFQQVAYVDSMALEMLLHCTRLARRQGGALKIAQVTSTCQDIFTATRLEHVLELYPDLANALQSFL